MKRLHTTTYMSNRSGLTKVIRHIGQGGSSNVYLCQQSHPRRQVALKLLKISQCEGPYLRRFQLEIDLLATLEHPAIARIFDAGVADIGRGPQAYYTMEYVKGLRLDHFLESKLNEHLCTSDRIKLFLQIADAVQCAHEQGIVHRDLKPSNILITESGEAKVIDFGLARMSDSELTVLAVTKTGQLVGTPLYMSPEQFSEGNQLIDARSDLYSLGVVLYRMLTGHLPYDLDKKPLIEIANKILNETPQPLGRVDARFRGDLEIIVGKTLEKDPAHRYQSLAALADDLQRFLDCLPILARRPSAIDPILRWRRQNPWTAAIAGAGAAMLLASFILAVTWMLIAQRRAGELSQMFVRAEEQSHLATRHARDLEQANVELRDAATRLQRATTNSTLMRAALSTENNPRLTRSLLFDTSLIPEDQRGFAWKVLERKSNWEHALREYGDAARCWQRLSRLTARNSPWPASEPSMSAAATTCRSSGRTGTGFCIPHLSHSIRLASGLLTRNRIDRLLFSIVLKEKSMNLLSATMCVLSRSRGRRRISLQSACQTGRSESGAAASNNRHESSASVKSKSSGSVFERTRKCSAQSAPMALCNCSTSTTAVSKTRIHSEYGACWMPY